MPLSDDRFDDDSADRFEEEIGEHLDRYGESHAAAGDAHAAAGSKRRFDEPREAHWDDDPDAPQACDMDADDDETPTAECPACGAEIAEDAQKCPHCGDWIVPDSGAAAPRRTPWFVIVALLLLATFVAWQMFF